MKNLVPFSQSTHQLNKKTEDIEPWNTQISQELKLISLPKKTSFLHTHHLTKPTVLFKSLISLQPPKNRLIDLYDNKQHINHLDHNILHQFYTFRLKKQSNNQLSIQQLLSPKQNHVHFQQINTQSQHKVSSIPTQTDDFIPNEQIKKKIDFKTQENEKFNYKISTKSRKKSQKDSKTFRYNSQSYLKNTSRSNFGIPRDENPILWIESFNKQRPSSCLMK